MGAACSANVGRTFLAGEVPYLPFGTSARPQESHRISKKTLSLLQSDDCPRHVRELKRLVERGPLSFPNQTPLVSDDGTLLFDILCEITKDVSITLMGGFPPKPIINGQGNAYIIGAPWKGPIWSCDHHRRLPPSRLGRLSTPCRRWSSLRDLP